MIPVLEAGMPLSNSYQRPALKAKKSLIADVVGINKDGTVCIECGNTPVERLHQFNLIFDEVLFLPFISVADEALNNEKLKQEVIKLTSERQNLEAENENLSRKLSEVKMELKRLAET